MKENLNDAVNLSHLLDNINTCLENLNNMKQIYIKD